MAAIGLTNAYLEQWFLTLLEVLNPSSSIHAFIEPFVVGKIKCVLWILFFLLLLRKISCRRIPEIDSPNLLDSIEPRLRILKSPGRTRPSVCAVLLFFRRKDYGASCCCLRLAPPTCQRRFPWPWDGVLQRPCSGGSVSPLSCSLQIQGDQHKQ